jgi:hypothetical protein
MIFETTIERYSYTQKALKEYSEKGYLELAYESSIDLKFREYILMRKSLVMYGRLEKASVGMSFPPSKPKAKTEEGHADKKPESKQNTSPDIKPEAKAKAASSLPAGVRWITIHPHGDKDSKGVPVMIKEGANGTAHIVGGAGGRLNMLKLNNIKSKEQYAEEAKKRRDAEKAQRDAEKRERQKRMADLTPEERKAVVASEKEKKNEAKENEEMKKEAIGQSKKEFVSAMAEMLGWEDKRDSMKEEYMKRRNPLAEKLKAAIDSGKKDEIKEIEKQIKVLDKAHESAVKSYESNLLQAAKSAVVDIQREAIKDETFRAALEERIGDKTKAEELIRTENAGNSLGFTTDYKGSAEKKGELTEEDLNTEKEEQWQKTLERVSKEASPQMAVMLERGLETRKAISEVKKEIFEKEDVKARITDIDQKAEAVKKYLAMQKTIKNLSGDEEKKPAKEVQITLDGDTEETGDAGDVSKLSYGDGLVLADDIDASDFAADLQKLEDKIVSDRQARANSSLLEKIKENPGGVEKWIANGHYNGFNQLSLAALKTDCLPRDVSDILGLRGSAQVLSEIFKKSMSDEDYKDATEAILRYHEATNEDAVNTSLREADELLGKASDLYKEIENIKATNPDDLHALNEANESRLRYLDEANRILGQTLGKLEASSALAMTMQDDRPVQKIESNLGGISSEEAIVRARALGLQKGDYQIDSVNGERILTVNRKGIDRIALGVDPEEIAVERDVDSIKAGAFDEQGWLPAGVVSRTVESFQDPGPDASLPEGDVDNQSIGDDPESFKGAQEAIHRTLGETPEGVMAFKKSEELSPQEQTDLRRYWEKNIYKGSTAESQSTREYQGEKAKTKAGEWKSFMAKNGDDESVAMEAIKKDLIDNRSSEDMFGMKEVHPLASADPSKPETCRGRVDGASALFDEIEGLEKDIEAGRITESEDKARREVEKLKAALPEKVGELYREQMKDHYLKFMSGVSEAEFEAGANADRHEGSPWGEYVRMHGSPEKAQAAILDTIKGDFLNRFSSNYGKITKKPLSTKKEKIAGHQEHILGMLGKEERDSLMNKVNAELASAGATVANRSGGKFASGSWKDKAFDLIQQRRRDDAAQGSFFGDEELKQEDGSERVSIGKRAEEQIASMIPDLSQNLRRGETFSVFAGMSMSGKHAQQQRAVKMFERTKRMNLTFGTGKGKSITSIGAFTNLHSKGLAKRAVFAVPSVVQKQFGGEVNRYLEPGKYKSVADPSLDREGRIAAMKDPSNHMVVFTHQSLRDDLVHLMSKKMGVSEEEAKNAFNDMPEHKRKEFLGETLKENGIDFGMMTVDESHYTTNRKGKEDSTTANVLDALNQNSEYFMNQSATPVKNDVSEAFDFLRKVAPDRFTDRNEFIKKYGVDSEHSREALQRLINRYNYASPTETGVKRNENKEVVQLSGPQKEAYDAATDAFRRASRAEKAGKVDIDAMKTLSPRSFEGKPEVEHEEIAKRLQGFAGAIKEEAYNRIVNSFDPESNAKIGKLMELVESKRYSADNPKTAAKKGDRAPGVVFAHNIASVESVKKAMESKGLRVGVIHGAMSGDEKDKVKTGFNPANPKDRQYDVIVLSDAGATGLNLQNAKYLVNYDLTQTSWVKEQREGRIDRNGQAHDEIDYHDLVTDTEHERKKWDRIQRKAKLGEIFQQDPGSLDDTGLAPFLAQVRQERYNHGDEAKRSA